MSEHFFDQAVALQPDGDNAFSGAAHPAWANMVGPFGGITAASALNGVLSHPHLLGAPIALTVNYAAALGPGGYRLAAVPVRTNRSTQHWTMAMTQPGADGAEATVLTATAVTAARRATWSQSDAPMPAAPRPGEAERLQSFGVEWLERYDMRSVRGALPRTWDGSGEDSLTQLWVRDEPGRPLDFLSVASLADVFYPRVWLRRATRVPAGTVSITTYFHADAAMLARSGTGYVFGQARAQAFSNGFFDQAVQLWNEAGELLATSHQIVYYKE
ncbi:acyl-CoA thioesterase II [Pseudorhodoferax sp. Leaf274]|uniref:acyl-CoA thioesterase n=1 Tax=Pseudorhodoferax sp. Leaf274 TaxID=1736318 RepID=UPI000703082D|nr:thioesterase family protein [Pseudorhodoferax sp. Leaf274]KQP45071.1 acyl-CoA thioesterase [Pseudorhodoferax sp. Leaf274]